MKTILELIDDLYELRAVYGALDADYRQGRLDVAIETLEALDGEREEVFPNEVWNEAIDHVESAYDVSRLSDE